MYFSQEIDQNSKLPVRRRIGHILAAVLGWKVSVAEPIPAKCVIIGAFHTSGWDLLWTLILRLATGLPFRFVVKARLVRGPLGWLMGRLGAIPVDRSISANFVDQMVADFDRHDTMILAISPEGTRGNIAYWRTGFYYIALGAAVPIVMGYGDYRRKVAGLGPVLIPSGDIEADLDEIRRFYAGVTAKYPEKQGDIRIRSFQEMD